MFYSQASNENKTEKHKPKQNKKTQRLSIDQIQNANIHSGMNSNPKKEKIFSLTAEQIVIVAIFQCSFPPFGFVVNVRVSESYFLLLLDSFLSVYCSSGIAVLNFTSALEVEFKNVAYLSSRLSNMRKNFYSKSNAMCASWTEEKEC